MPLDVKLYNVLFYEPESTKTGLKIATPILTEVEDRANARFTNCAEANACLNPPYRQGWTL